MIWSDDGETHASSRPHACCWTANTAQLQVHVAVYNTQIYRKTRMIRAYFLFDRGSMEKPSSAPGAETQTSLLSTNKLIIRPKRWRT